MGTRIVQTHGNTVLVAFLFATLRVKKRKTKSEGGLNLVEIVIVKEIFKAWIFCENENDCYTYGYTLVLARLTFSKKIQL